MPTRKKETGYIRPKINELTQPNLISKIMVGLLSLTALAVFLALSASLFSNTKAQVDRDSYQVVFLADQQVYFGKLSNIHSPYVTLSDVHQIGGQEIIEDEEAAGPGFSLVRVSDQFYGPKDAMYISRDSIVFWNNLQSDSQIIELIKDLR